MHSGPWRHAAPSHGAQTQGQRLIISYKLDKCHEVSTNSGQWSQVFTTGTNQCSQCPRWGLRRLGCIENTETDTGLCVHWIGTCHAPAIVQTYSRTAIICTHAQGGGINVESDTVIASHFMLMLLSTFEKKKLSAIISPRWHVHKTKNFL